jgi:hypothetical protein
MGEVVELATWTARSHRPRRVAHPANQGAVVVRESVYHMVVCRPLGATDAEALALVDDDPDWLVVPEDEVHPTWEPHLGVCPDEPARCWHFLVTWRQYGWRP